MTPFGHAVGVDRGGGAVPADAGAAGVDAVLAVGEEADGEHAEGAADAVDRDGADRIVDLQLALDEEHRLDDDDTGDDAEDRGRPTDRRRRTGR